MREYYPKSRNFRQLRKLPDFGYVWCQGASRQNPGDWMDPTPKSPRPLKGGSAVLIWKGDKIWQGVNVAITTSLNIVRTVSGGNYWFLDIITSLKILMQTNKTGQCGRIPSFDSHPELEIGIQFFLYLYSSGDASKINQSIYSFTAFDIPFRFKQSKQKP